MSVEELRILVAQADIWEARDTFEDVMLGVQGEELNPFTTRSIIKSTADELIKIGARSLYDLAHLDPKKITTIPMDVLTILMKQPLVLLSLDKVVALGTFRARVRLPVLIMCPVEAICTWWNCIALWQSGPAGPLHYSLSTQFE